MNKKLISFALFGLLVGSFTQTKCVGEEKNTKNETTIKASCCCPISCFAQKLGKPGVAIISAVLGLAIYRLYSKKAVQEPVSRFDFEKLKDASKNLNFKDAAGQIWYLIDDVIIGQMHKKDGVKADKEGKLEVSKGNPSAGFMGTLQGKIFPISMALFFALEVKEFMNKLAKSSETIGLCTACAK